MNKIEQKLNKLPPNLQEEVLDFIDYLIQKKLKTKTGKRPYGLCKGEIKIAETFYDPLDDETLKEWGIL